jgi:glycosyltransferase involved in cell wall biosynthesis
LPRTVVIAPNSDWNIVTFRQGLIRGIQAAGYDPVVLAPSDPAVERRMQQLGVDRVRVDIERSGMNPLADLRLLLQYRRLLKELAPAAFLGFTIKPNIYGSIAARLTGVPAIANVSGLGTVFLKSGLLERLVVPMYRYALGRADRVFFQNPDDRQLFVRKKIVRPEQARLVPGSGIDVDLYAPSALPDGPPTFLLIARVLGDKGVREFVEAARSLRGELHGARFQLLGPFGVDNRTSISRAELDRWVARGDIEYLGSTDDVRPFIAEATAVVLPSYREGLPRSLLEGAAMARPLIATDVPGCRQLVEDGVTGFLCAARDSASLAEAMKKLARLSPQERRRMGEAARAMVEQRYSEEFVVRAYLDALAELVPAARSIGASASC